MNARDEALVRPARGSDAAGVARVHIESSRDAYAPLARVWPEPDWEHKKAYWQSRLTPRQADSASVDFVAEARGSIVGFISGGEARQAGMGAAVEVYVIHVLPQHRRTGIGGRLWSEACARIRGENLRAMYVSTLAELRCCFFYEHRGGVCTLRSARNFHGAPATDVRYFWEEGCSHDVASGPRTRTPGK